MSSTWLQRQGDGEGRPFAGSALGHDGRPVALGDPAAECQADARAGVGLAARAGARTPGRSARRSAARTRCRCRSPRSPPSCPITRPSICTTGRHSLLAELDGVRDEVLEQLAHPQRIGADSVGSSPTSTVAPASWITVSRSATTSSSHLGEVAPARYARPCVVIRENASRSSIRSCIRWAASVIRVEVVAPGVR